MSTPTVANETRGTHATTPARSTNPLVRFLTLDFMDKPAMLDAGLLVLRLSMLLLFFHGWAKATGYSGFVGMMSEAPVGSIAPALFGFMVVAGQLLLGFGLALGLMTRICAFLMALMFVFIIVLFNIPGGWFGEHGGIAFEGSLYYFVPGVVLFLTGPGRYSVDYLLSRKTSTVR